ncbi:hypothetical protein L3Q82_018032 [Scortum barcoo]|uniref:Uncharacterized protein n=1 Tax=Scortum barcoo TaxID=214431 RepID=A0ACB8VKV8_9TELE|nr:hypothetical protein L3Q82_018032 [Scortum barcoo]
MLKKLFHVVALLALCGLACEIVFLFFSKNTYIIKPYYVANGNNVFSSVINDSVQGLWNMNTDDPKANQEMQTPTNKTLGPCPETPPNLVGPLNVEFDYQRMFDDVSYAVRPKFREGGRYKPPDCVSRQKVAIIIPFRNRHEHLKHWLFYLHPILMRQQLDYEFNMLKKLFHVVALLALCGLACETVFLFFSKNTYIIKPYYVANGNNIFSSVINDSVQGLWNMNTDDPKANQEMQTPTSKTLGPCPETPPNLVGPLNVEFDYQRMFDDVSYAARSKLQKGGRYKPPDCVSRQKVAIIIPFRNRHEHLKHWLFYLHPILMRQQLDYGVYIINQDGVGVFNRAKLMNIGYAEAVKDYDYECFIFSDVDLIPMDDRNLYRCFDNPRHLSVAIDKFNFRLPYQTIFGGVSALSKEQYLKINGFSNAYWGWGGEDDDIFNRIKFSGMSISRPDMVVGRYRMIKHNRDLHNEPNPKSLEKLHKTQWTMDKDGINSLEYTVKEIVKNRLYTFITVDVQAPPS